MRFKSGSGIYLKGDTYMIGDTEPGLIRSIDVDERVEQEIDNVILNLDATVASTIENLKGMKTHTINSIKQAEILGVMFAERKILTSEQAASVAKQIKSGVNITLSSFYNEIAIALKKSHPRNWMDSQRILYEFLVNTENNLSKLATEMAKVEPLPIETDPAQVNMLDQIQEMENVLIENDKAMLPPMDVAEVGTPMAGVTSDGSAISTSPPQDGIGDCQTESPGISLDVAEVGPPREGTETGNGQTQSSVQQTITGAGEDSSSPSEKVRETIDGKTEEEPMDLEYPAKVEMLTRKEVFDKYGEVSGITPELPDPAELDESEPQANADMSNITGMPKPDVAEVEPPSEAGVLGAMSEGHIHQGSDQDIDPVASIDVADINPPSSGVVESTSEQVHEEICEETPGPEIDAAELIKPELETTEVENSVDFIIPEDDEEAPLSFEL
jgi:hypothetical protein